MKSACPSDFLSTLEQYSAVVAWLQELLECFPSGTQYDRSLRHDMQAFFYEDTSRFQIEHPWFTFDHFSKTLAGLACLSLWQLADVLQDDSVKVTLGTLACQANRFFFFTDSGRIGYSSRQPCLEGRIVFVPRTDPRIPLHMLNADCTQYFGYATVLGLMNDSLLGAIDDMQTKWDVMCLR
jgi:hypothetical protein